MKTINHWRVELKETSEDGKISQAHRLAESISWKWLYYQKQFLSSIQSPSKFQW
jgi:hypothetical protein